jgi:hypothetical protein
MNMLLPQNFFEKDILWYCDDLSVSVCMSVCLSVCLSVRHTREPFEYLEDGLSDLDKKFYQYGPLCHVTLASPVYAKDDPREKTAKITLYCRP